MRKVHNDYSFTQKELEALSAIINIGRRDWLSSEVQEALSSYLLKKELRDIRNSVRLHRFRVLGR